MRYKLLLIVLLVVSNELSAEGVEGPPTTEKKKKDNEETKTDEYISHVPNDDGEELSALKIIQAPDLSKKKDQTKGDSPDEVLESADLSMLKQAKWLQKVVQEIGGFQYTIVSNDQEIAGTIEEEDAPPVLEPLVPRELTPQEIEGNTLSQI